MVDRVARPTAVSDFGDFRSSRREQRPVTLPHRALFDPAPDQLDVAVFQLFVTRISGRHSPRRIWTCDPQVQFTFRQIARNDDTATTRELDFDALLVVETKLRFSIGRVRPMAGETFVGKDGTNVAVEFNGLNRIS